MEEFKDLVNKNENTITKNKAKNYNMLSLAYVGDAVHSLFIRTKLTANSTKQAGKLHLITNTFVKASAQSYVLDNLLNFLTEKEKQIVKRARNTSSKTTAKNASLEDYKKATSFEALLGFLYLTDQTKRMNEILNLSFEIMEKK